MVTTSSNKLYRVLLDAETLRLAIVACEQTADSIHSLGASDLGAKLIDAAQDIRDAMADAERHDDVLTMVWSHDSEQAR